MTYPILLPISFLFSRLVPFIEPHLLLPSSLLHPYSPLNPILSPELYVHAWNMRIQCLNSRRVMHTCVHPRAGGGGGAALACLLCMLSVWFIQLIHFVFSVSVFTLVWVSRVSRCWAQTRTCRRLIRFFPDRLASHGLGLAPQMCVCLFISELVIAVCANLPALNFPA